MEALPTQLAGSEVTDRAEDSKRDCSRAHFLPQSVKGNHAAFLVAASTARRAGPHYICIPLWGKRKSPGQQEAWTLAEPLPSGCVPEPVSRDGLEVSFLCFLRCFY